MSHRTNHCGRGGRIESLERRRLLAIPGTLDPTFSGDGVATFNAPGLSASDVAVQADGKTIVVGTETNTSTGETKFAVGRFNVNGTPDPSFGLLANGLVTTQLSNEGESNAEAVAIAPNGKIVVVGTARVDSGFSEEELAVARYNPDGTPDNTFDDNGVLSLDLGTVGTGGTLGFDVAVQPDGKMVIVGTTHRTTDRDFFVIRLNDNGTFDQQFAFAGRNFIDFAEADIAVAVKLASDGAIFVAGHADVGSPILPGFIRRVGVLRLSAVGEQVGSFGGDGKIGFELPNRTITEVADLLVQPDGKVIIAGHSPDATGQHDWFVARFNADGTPDPTFGELAGFTVTDLGGNDIVGGMAFTPTGGGGGFLVSGNSSGMAVAKYTDNGLPDNSFDGDGERRLFQGGTANIAPGPGRRFMLAGGNNFTTARVLLANARIVTAGVVDNLAVEGTTNTGSLFVGRTENLPFETLVHFGISGSASISTSRTGGSRDYVMTGMTISPTTLTSGTGVVIIPAGQTFVTIPLSTLNDSLREITETANFTVLSNSIYEIGSPSSATISIRDDDTSNLSIGTTTVDAPPKHVCVGQEVQAAVTWTVPEGGWRQLSTIQLRLRDRKDDDALAILSFDEATNSFSIESTPGAENLVTLVPERSTFQAAGPTAPTVTIIFTFVFNASAANTRFRLDVGATNDGEDFSGFEEIGELHVHKKPNGDALALPL